jgi:hypothetical protein
MRSFPGITARLVLALSALVLVVAVAPVSSTTERPFSGATVIPLRADRPSWVTDELLARARNGSVRVPTAAIPDAPASGFVGIRPGSLQVAPYQCTMNFVFKRGSSYAIGTAGHCVDKVGQRVTLLTVAPGTSNPVLVDIGKVIARSHGNNRIAPDFALVAIRPELNDWVFPTIAQIGGPCGAYKGAGVTEAAVPVLLFSKQHEEVGPELISHYGHGLGIGTGGTPRSGVAVYWDKAAYLFNSAAIFGDSGSPARVSDLSAAGNVTALVVDTRYPGAFIAGTRITAIQKIAGSWSLVSSPYCP